MKKYFPFILLLTSHVLCGFSQTLLQPNYALKSHETLIISKIDISPGKTVVYLSIENRIKEGNFCADKDIFIIYPDGTRIRLIQANGIPVCPEVYKFKSIGEKIDFTLTFPSLKSGAEWIDLVEECSSNCFSFFGVTLDTGLNRKIDEAYTLAEQGETGKAVSAYMKIIENNTGRNCGIDGALYTDLITLLHKSGDTLTAKKWYERMLNSNTQRLDQYIKNLNSAGIKF